MFARRPTVLSHLLVFASLLPISLAASAACPPDIDPVDSHGGDPLSCIDTTAWIDRTSVVGERAIVGALSKIYSGSEAGDQLTVGAEASIKQSILGNDVTIGADTDLVRVTVGDNTNIASRADVSRNAQIGRNVVIGQRTRINRNTTIADDVQISSSVRISYRVAIGAGAIIKANTRIRNSATIGEGSVVGANVLIGKRARVEANAVVPDGTVVRDDALWLATEPVTETNPPVDAEPEPELPVEQPPAAPVPTPTQPTPTAPETPEPVEEPQPAEPVPSEPETPEPAEDPQPAVPVPTEPVTPEPVEEPQPAEPVPTEPETPEPVEEPQPAEPVPTEPETPEPVEEPQPAEPVPTEPETPEPVEEPQPIDIQTPVITLLGSNPLQLQLGDSYREPGAQAQDDVDGNLDAQIVIDDSNVNTQAAGSYVVVYSVSDSAGNTATSVSRTVRVVDDTIAFANYYVAPDGDDNNAGTLDSPFATWARVQDAVQPGDLVYFRGGTYRPATMLRLTSSGVDGAPVHYWAFPGETPVFDYSRLGPSDQGMLIFADWLHIKGIEFQNATRSCLRLGAGNGGTASNNTLEALSVHDCGNAGIFAWGGSRGGVANNLFLNVDAFRNFHPPENGNQGDGIVVGGRIGTGNVVRGCRAWDNADDGFDFWRAGNPVVLEGNWAFRNGFNIFNHPGTWEGGGNGFKLGQSNGGNDAHIVINNLAFGNSRVGIHDNSNVVPMTIRNNTSFNHSRNFDFEGQQTTFHELRNNLSFQGSIRISDVVDSEYNSWDDTSDLDVSAADFESMDSARMTGPRSPTGELPTTNFLLLRADSALQSAGENGGPLGAER